MNCPHFLRNYIQQPHHFYLLLSPALSAAISTLLVHSVKKKKNLLSSFGLHLCYCQVMLYINLVSSVNLQARSQLMWLEPKLINWDKFAKLEMELFMRISLNLFKVYQVIRCSSMLPSELFIMVFCLNYIFYYLSFELESMFLYPSGACFKSSEKVVP